MFFHIVSIVMCLYIRIIPYWLFLSYLIYIWFCFQSVIFSEKLLRNSKNPFQRFLFLFLRSKPDFLKFFPVFQENLGFYLKILIFFPNNEQSWAMSISVYSVFFVPIIFLKQNVYYIIIYIIYNIKNIISISK